MASISHGEVLATTEARDRLPVREFDGMPHLLPAAPGWEAIADEVLDWALEHAGRRAPEPV